MGGHCVVVERLPEDPHGSAPNTLKALRLLDPSLDLKEVKELAIFASSRLPCVVAAGLAETRARSVAEAIAQAGGAARVEANAITVPMLLRPTLAR